MVSGSPRSTSAVASGDILLDIRVCTNVLNIRRDIAYVRAGVTCGVGSGVGGPGFLVGARAGAQKRRRRGRFGG